MARGRKKKVVEEVKGFKDTGELDVNDQKIYEAPLNIDKEAASGLALAAYFTEDDSNDEKISNVNWDFKIEDSVEFFDSTLTYELTGYRPIDEHNSLDFNPEWFTEIKQVKIQTGSYCSYPPGGKKYVEFWKDQYKKCNEGMISHGYRITGDNYFFLNFYRLKDITNISIAGAGRETGFPSFYSKQYEYFHYIELASKLGKDVCALKARGVGFSEIAASLGVRRYSTVRGSHVVYTAYSDDFLSAVLRKCWEQLDYLNSDTEDGMRHVRQRYNSDTFKRASKLDKQREESGFMSEILGITANIPRKLRGDRADLLLFEEAGSNPVLVKTYIQSKALVEISGNKFGIRIVWGTGGDSGPALSGLSSMFINPTKYNILPYKHNYTKTGETILSSYFIPAFTFVSAPGFVDNRGVTDTKKAKEYYEKNRINLLDDSTAYIAECAEFCFTPDDALALEGDNDFDTVALQEQLSRIILHKEGPEIEKGFLEYKFSSTTQSSGTISGFKWIPNNKGKVLILQHPLLDANNKPYRNLYVAGIDAIDLGKDDTADGTKEASDFAVVIKKRALGLEPPAIVAIYKDRPKDIREAFKIATRMLEYYNCKAVLEKSKVSFALYLRDIKKDNQLLMKRPRATLGDIKRGYSKEYGVPATEPIIRHQLDLIAAYITDYSQEIWFEELLQEGIKYSYANKRKFDLIAAWGMAELGDEELAGIIPRQVEVQVDEWKDIGWYKDERGYTQYGEIPTKIDVPNYNLFKNDDNRIRTSRPINY